MAPILSEEELTLDPYALLGIEAGATTKDAERAFRKKSLKYHPDKVRSHPIYQSRLWCTDNLPL